MGAGDSLFLIAEIAVSLVAAAGISTAIGGRDRSYSPADRARVRSLVIVSTTPFFIAFIGIALLTADIQQVQVRRILSFLYILLSSVRVALTSQLNLRLWRPTTKTQLTPQAGVC